MESTSSADAETEFCGFSEEKPVDRESELEDQLSGSGDENEGFLEDDLESRWV